jgi:hypothetical protein
MSSWPSADWNAHVRIVSVALAASSIFVAVGLAAQGNSIAITPNHQNLDGIPSPHHPTKFTGVASVLVGAPPAQADRCSVLGDPNT